MSLGHVLGKLYDLDLHWRRWRHILPIWCRLKALLLPLFGVWVEHIGLLALVGIVDGAIRLILLLVWRVTLIWLAVRCLSIRVH